jgi:CheY-like chemotaxis protein
MTTVIANPVFLYVEDDMFSREVISLLIQDVLGYNQLTIFDSSENFKDRVCKLLPQPDIIFLDIQIRPHDGYAMLKMLSDEPRFANTIVIAMTANVMSHDVEKLRSVGFNGLIGKPLIKEIFPQLIEKILMGESVWYIP